MDQCVLWNSMKNTKQLSSRVCWFYFPFRMFTYLSLIFRSLPSPCTDLVVNIFRVIINRTMGKLLSNTITNQSFVQSKSGTGTSKDLLKRIFYPVTRKRTQCQVPRPLLTKYLERRQLPTKQNKIKPCHLIGNTLLKDNNIKGFILSFTPFTNYRLIESHSTLIYFGNFLSTLHVGGFTWNQVEVPIVRIVSTVFQNKYQGSCPRES